MAHIEIMQNHIIGLRTISGREYFKGQHISKFCHVEITQILFDGENYLVLLDDSTGIQIHGDFIEGVNYKMRILTEQSI
jgi:hypothetical protein